MEGYKMKKIIVYSLIVFVFCGFFWNKKEEPKLKHIKEYVIKARHQHDADMHITLDEKNRHVTLLLCYNNSLVRWGMYLTFDEIAEFNFIMQEIEKAINERS